MLPLLFSAAKSRYGHAEPAAGSVGLVHAAAQLVAHTSSPVTALTTLNPYVVSSLAELRAAGLHVPHMSRQAAPGVSQLLLAEAMAQAVAGVSAFAFQGTNAHAVLGRSLAPQPAVDSSFADGRWRRQRFWYAPSPHQMLQHCTAALQSGSVALHCQLSSASLAYIADHQVRDVVTGMHAHLALFKAIGVSFAGSQPFIAFLIVSVHAGARPHPLPRCRHA